MKLSVIVPMYNVEEHVEKCLESLYTKVYENDYEIIVINDGSTDRGKAIVQEHQLHMQNLKFIDGENYGVSHARNKGIEAAKGEYITFVDSDDWWTAGAVECILADIEKQVDMVIYGVEKDFFKEGEIVKKEFKFGETSYVDQVGFAEDYRNKELNFNLASPWAKLYRRDLIVKNQLLFNEQMKQYEDVWFNLSYIPLCHSFCFSDVIVYHWRRNDVEKHAKRIYLGMAEDVHKCSEKMLVFMNAMELDAENKEILHDTIVARYTDCFRNYKFLRENNTGREIMDRIYVLSKDDILLKYIPKNIKCPKKMKLLIWLLQRSFFRVSYILLMKGYR